MVDEPELTKNQTLVLDKLCAANGPMSAYDLLDELRDEGLKAPLQIYRALEKLQQVDLVHRLESMNSFVACAQPHCHQSMEIVAFAICEDCGTVAEFGNESVQSTLRDWTNSQGFVPSKTNLEIRGKCVECAN